MYIVQDYSASASNSEIMACVSRRVLAHLLAVQAFKEVKKLLAKSSGKK
jgi:hypothetical protein